jgi:hypothetical protein
VIARSEALADRFQQRLQGALRATIAEKGLVGAVSVCSTLAPAIAAEESAASGARIGRIAARNRNPAAGVPRDFATHYAELAANPVEAGKPATRVWNTAGPKGHGAALPVLPWHRPRRRHQHRRALSEGQGNGLQARRTARRDAGPLDKRDAWKA